MIGLVDVGDEKGNMASNLRAKAMGKYRKKLKKLLGE